MATRARIGIKRADGTILSAYQHWDGYPGGLGYTLINHWESPTKTEQAIQLGNASKWGYFVGSKIDFDNRESEMYEYQNIYYMRDRGEKDQGPKVFKDWGDYLKNGFNSGEEYIYLQVDTGRKDYMGRNPIGDWCFAHYSNATGFKPLYEVAVKEHIEQWQQDLKQKEVA